MTPAAIALLVQGFVAVMAEAPHIVELAQQAKDYFATLFQNGLITKETQDALAKHVDDVIASFASNTPPPAWTVEPDPV